MARSRIKLSEKYFTKLLLNTNTKEDVVIRAVANIKPILSDILKLNVLNEELKISKINFQKDDIENRTRFQHEREILGFSCYLSHGEDDDFQRLIYLKINSLECKSKCCNFTIKEKSMKLICINNKFYWEFIAIKIH